jgi:hypothetical protein
MARLLSRIAFVITMLSLFGCKKGKPLDSRQVPAAQTSTAISGQQEAGLAKPTLVSSVPTPSRIGGAGFVGVIFPANSEEMPGLYPPGASYWTPSESDVIAAEDGLIPFLAKSKDPKAPEILKQIGAYKRQYRGIVLGGRKQIFIRFFCEISSEDWTSREMVVLDGGSCFFNLRFSPATKTFSNLWINGEG